MWQSLIGSSCDETISKNQKIITNGGAVIEKLMKTASAEKKKVLADSLIFNYQKGLELFTSDLKLQELLGIAIAKYKKNHELSRIHLKNSISGLEQKSKKSAVRYYFNSIQNLKLQKKITREGAVQEFLWLKQLFPDQKTQSILDQTGLQWLDCNDIIEYYRPFINDDSVSDQLIEEALNLMNEKDCYSDQNYASFYLKVLTIILQRNPTANGYWFKSKYELSRGEKQEANESLKKGYEIAPDSGSIRLDLINYGATYFGDFWEEERLANFPNDGRSWLYKAKKVAKLVNDVEVHSDLVIRKLVFVRAIEYCKKAKAADRNLKEEADGLIKFYRGQLPVCNQLFQRGIQRGETYSLNKIGDVVVDCN